MPSFIRNSAKGLDRVDRGIGFAFFFGTIEFFVVRKRVRIRADHLCVNERRAFAGTAIFDGAFENRVGFERIGAVAFLNVEIGKTNDQL
jgi:hypothetical protein